MPVGGKSGSHRPGAIDEQLDGGRHSQRAHRNQDFAGNAERLAARRDQPQTGHRSGQRLGQGGRLVDHVLAVVQDDHKRPPGQEAHDELHRRVRRRRANEAGHGRPECAGHRRRNPLGLGDARELDQPDPVPVLVGAARRPPLPPAGSCPPRRDRSASPAGSSGPPRSAPGVRLCDRRSCSTAPAGCPLPSAPEPPQDLPGRRRRVTGPGPGCGPRVRAAPGRGQCPAHRPDGHELRCRRARPRPGGRPGTGRA